MSIDTEIERARATNNAMAALARAITGAGDSPKSAVMRRWDAEREMIRTDPLLAALYRVEAICDDRAENHMCDDSKMAAVKDTIRRVVAQYTGAPFRNPLFP